MLFFSRKTKSNLNSKTNINSNHVPKEFFFSELISTPPQQIYRVLSKLNLFNTIRETSTTSRFPQRRNKIWWTERTPLRTADTSLYFTFVYPKSNLFLLTFTDSTMKRRSFCVPRQMQDNAEIRKIISFELRRYFFLFLH